MANPILRGSVGMTLESVELISDPQRGIVQRSVWTGVIQRNAVALVNQYISNGIAATLNQKGGVYRVVSDDATANNPIDNWELIGDSERKDLFQNPAWGYEVNITAAQMAIIRQHLENNDTVTVAFAAGQTPDMSAIPDIVKRGYSRYQAGNDEFENDAYAGGYTLKHTTNAPARWTNNVADFNVGKIYSTANLVTEILQIYNPGTGSGWVFPCPPSLVYAINLAGANVPASQANYFWGWKKGRSNRETAARNRINIVQSYILELWSTDDYEIN